MTSGLHSRVRCSSAVEPNERNASAYFEFWIDNDDAVVEVVKEGRGGGVSLSQTHICLPPPTPHTHKTKYSKAKLKYLVAVVSQISIPYHARTHARTHRRERPRLCEHCQYKVNVKAAGLKVDIGHIQQVNSNPYAMHPVPLACAEQANVRNEKVFTRMLQALAFF